MGILQRIFKPRQSIIKQPRFTYSLGGSVAPERDYVKSYGEIGWLFAVISKIAVGVSDSRWRLYKGSDRSERSQVAEHPILELLDYVNPFLTGAESLELTQMYIDLCGECFWVMNFNGLKEPAEIWIPQPSRMQIIPSKEKFIQGYVYQNGTEKTPFTANEIIHFKLPNPSNPYRGLSPTQAISIDLDSEYYAGRWNRNFFYNSARPDGVIEFEDTLTDEQYEKLKLQWSERHQGVNKAHHVGLLEGGGKYKQIQISQKDMDFHAMRILNRDAILGVFGMPLSVMGITENVNKANAEAGEYTFARWIVKPRLNRIKNKLNEQFIPLFRNSKNLELDYDEVVPQTIEQKMQLAESGIRAGYLTINEARKLRGLDPLSPEVGDVLLTPFNLNPTPVGAQKSAFFISKSLKDEQKELYWRAHVAKAERRETQVIKALGGLWEDQEKEVLSKMDKDEPFNLESAKEKFNEKLHPVLFDILRDSFESTKTFLTRADEHELPEKVIEWLKKHALWLVKEINEKTRADLRRQILAGVELGEDMPTIARRVRSEFEYCEVRRSKVIARTEVISAMIEGSLAGYEELGVEQVEFFAALDERLCDECLALHGDIYDLKDSHKVIPVHPQCRCDWLPV